MKGAAAYVPVDADTLRLAIACERAQFEALEGEWKAGHAADDVSEAQAKRARVLRESGERLIVLERRLAVVTGAADDYTAGVAR